MAVYGIPLFDGSSPILTRAWLDNVEECFPLTEDGKDMRGCLARIRLTGKAEKCMRRLIPNDWEGFRERMIDNFNPDVAYAQMTAAITSGKRYIGLGKIRAIEAAEDDYNDILTYHGTKSTELAPFILIALCKLFPSQVITAAQLDLYGDFKRQIFGLRILIST
ncbi:hypothetical protein IW146_005766 [Coemansia sp. RSA 922]|nr:hypothetical protein H4S04_000604 [Coemansia sp. S16]KAJ2109550.1 hypothetical protein GGI16_000683 [Coemansia sp. S142-1]KAJ2110769.1 hypothetical protein IW146_005766 [Coemansia sp. RSA 922]KAJ2336168.1 hypothetical protein GGH92_007831 [Coemansia sp. RSA 2673]